MVTRRPDPIRAHLEARQAERAARLGTDQPTDDDGDDSPTLGDVLRARLAEEGADLRAAVVARLGAADDRGTR